MFIWRCDVSYPRKLCFLAMTPRCGWWDLLICRYLHLFIGWRGIVLTHFSDSHDGSCAPCTPFKGLFMGSLKRAHTPRDPPLMATRTPPPSPPWAQRGGGSCAWTSCKEQSWQEQLQPSFKPKLMDIDYIITVSLQFSHWPLSLPIGCSFQLLLSLLFCFSISFLTYSPTPR